jgi:exopolyphosphatase / guanosine-5'-triphosphate,3'-diphosphate pyrophosphatase
MSSAAPVIIPRWEYRVFGESFGEAEAKIHSHGEAKARSSAETYIVSFDSPNNTKIRDGLMDIKKLENVNGDTLEQWNPVLKSGFPLTREVLAQVCAAWGVTLPETARETFTLEEFLGEVVAPHARLRAVAVAKERFGLMVDGCIVELANLTFDGTPIRTAAVEHEDPALVIATVRKLGLSDFENTNYIKALKRFAAVPVP